MKTHALIATSLLTAAVSIALAGLVPAQSPVKQVESPPVLLVARGAQSPIQVRSLAVTTEVDGGLARTRIELTFHNPNARRLEGELQFPLQPRQQVSGFALDVDGRMRAAVPVEKARGQEVFEAVERHAVDPGLLEQTAGNQFRLRVYPIPANGERRVRIDIDQSLDRDRDGWLLRLPLEFAKGIGAFPLHVIARGQGAAPQVTSAAGDLLFARDGDGYTATVGDRSPIVRDGLALRFAAARQPQAFVQELDGQHFFHAEIPLPGASAPRILPKTIGLLWDSSASARHRDIDSELAVLDRYFAAAGNAEVRLTRLRDGAEPVRSFPVRHGDWSALRNELRSTVYDGASALADWKPQPDVGEYLLVSDGFSNYGIASGMPRLAPDQRLYALDSAGADSDVARLNAWADARGGRVVSWQGAQGVADAVAQLLREGPRLVSLEGRGADGLVTASRFPQSGYLRVAGRLRNPAATITLTIDDHGRQRRIDLPIGANAPASDLVATLWAGYTIAALEEDPERQAAQIHRLGSTFGLVTAQTSLIVLENASDYLRYDIAPPEELRGEAHRLLVARDADQASARRQQLDRIAGEFADKLAWWQKPWPKTAPQLAVAQAQAGRGGSAQAAMPAAPRPASAPIVTSAPMRFEDSAAADAMAEAPPPPAPVTTNAAAPAGSTDRARTLDTVTVTGSRVRRVDQETASPVLMLDRRKAADEEDTNTDIGIAMHAWQPDSPYARRLHDAKADQVYAVYLRERGQHADSSAFYLDVADILFQRGQPELALRVLSNLAEMNLENRQLLRVLGYRLLEAHQAAQAVRVFEHVSRLAPGEPQSWRDLGLAYEADGHDQAAVEALYKVVSGTWDGRFPSVELIALGEMDAIVANARTRVDTHAIDPRLLRNLPLDLRVVLSWDSDNTDIDLWVTDPNGERTFYGSPHSYQGGWLSHDCTQGYGPEEFILRHAKPGRYKVEANFYGDHSQLITGPTTVQLHLFTGFGSPRQKDQAVAMRLKDAKETVLVGEFEVK